MVKKHLESVSEQRIVDRTTGEIVESSTTTRQYQAFTGGYYSETKGYKYRARSGKVVRMAIDAANLGDKLNNTEIGRLYRLACKMWAGSGVLAEVSRGKVRPLGKQELYEVMGFASVKRGRTFLNKLLALSLLRQVTVKMAAGQQEQQFYLNPLYFSPAYINRNMYLLWRDQIDRYIPEAVRLRFLNEEGDEQ